MSAGIVNGSAATPSPAILQPLSLKLPPSPPSGPASSWPKDNSDTEPDAATSVAATSDTATPVATPEHPLRDALASAVSRRRAPNGDTVITWAMAATVAVVAVDAAIVSYSHIYDLATGQAGNGIETGIQPRLLPLSIDGIIAEASLVLLYAARHKLRDRPRLATFMLWLGIVATVAANVAHGLPSSMLPPVAHVVISALLSAWPAGAFIGSVEMAMGLVRASRSVATHDDTTATASSDTSGDTSGDNDTDKNIDSSDDKKRRQRRPRPRRAAQRETTQRPDRVGDTIKKHPEWDNDTVAKACGVDVRTVQRRRRKLADAT